MVNLVPDSWKYTDEMEMLFFFYQCSDELLSENSPDTYALPFHNSMSLMYEIEYTYNLLEQYHLINKYYTSYIPVVIDEFLNSLSNDYILKKALGYRLDSIKTGLCEAKVNHVLLQRWLDLFNQSCNNKQYRELYSEELISLITETKSKKDLRYCTSNFYVAIMNSGYSREYMYNLVERYFDNASSEINQPTQIIEFIHQFDCSQKDFEFLVLMDIEAINYIERIKANIRFLKNITKIDVQKERKSLSADYSTADLLKNYDELTRRSREHQSISIVKYAAQAVDPYYAIESLIESCKSLQSFSRYFIHYTPTKQVYKALLKKANGVYFEIKVPSILFKRPYVSQAIIDDRIRMILRSQSMSKNAFSSLSSAIQMHADALDSKNVISLFRNFWIALETLFAEPADDENRENVIKSVISIIQKTYVLKLLRTLFFQVRSAINKSNLETLNIYSFSDFTLYFSSYSEDSAEMKELYKFLSKNPLLRSRIYEMRKNLGTGQRINALLLNHSQKIEWQLQRIYRARNIATHLGEQMPFMHILVNHLHNYFDYVINYIICKSENRDYISNVQSIIFEAKCDNRIHLELLKSFDMLTKANYQSCLFGPDTNLINYSFEFFE